jgi:hypothetical protein
VDKGGTELMCFSLAVKFGESRECGSLVAWWVQRRMCLGVIRQFNERDIMRYDQGILRFKHLLVNAGTIIPYATSHSASAPLSHRP